jgi:DNA-binding MarR family transcriptional regulator/GNAT superfamily N-acetyltransferase
MPDAVAALRAFNRFYTGQLGMLGPGFLSTPHTLAEARVLFELAQEDQVEVAVLRERMRIDAGHLSRLLGRLERRGLVARERSAADGRRQLARLTPAGEADFAVLDERSAAETGARLAGLGEAQRQQLVAALAEVRALLEPTPPARDVVIRPPRPGDLGWVVERHGQIYAEEHGWNAEFEGLVARIVADFAATRDPAREAMWVAEVDGRPAGCIFCVRADDDVAKLRLLLVEPRARGLRLGTRLVDECIAFARAAGYRELTLWTNDTLVFARAIYERAGFRLVDEAPHHSFGHDLVGQTWQLTL